MDKDLKLAYHVKKATVKMSNIWSILEKFYNVLRIKYVFVYLLKYFDFMFKLNPCFVFYFILMGFVKHDASS